MKSKTPLNSSHANSLEKNRAHPITAGKVCDGYNSRRDKNNH